jgi:hypothetical protein
MATSSPFVENFVSPYFSLHSDFAELARCYAPLPTVSINALLGVKRLSRVDEHTTE